MTKTLCVFNCHEAWVYQLACLGFNLDIITHLPGLYKNSWDYNIRPLPKKSRLITLDQALKYHYEYHCIITHNVKDLLDIKNRPEPKIMIIHMSLNARIELENP